jgi:hypothetical protein
LTGKRQRILRGMLEAVGTLGYEQTTVQDAIAKAGLYRQAFYDNRSKLRGALAGLLSFLDEQPEIGRALLVEVHAGGERAVERRTMAMERAAEMMDGAREESDGIAPAISAEAVVAGILAVLHTRLAARQTEGFDGLLPELMYLAVLPYFGAEAAAAEMRA